MTDKIQKDNRKALPKFLLMLLAAGILGGILGFGIAFAAERQIAEQVAGAVDAILTVLAPWGIPVTSVVLLGGALLQLKAARVAYNAWDGEDEAVIDGVEEKLSWALLLTTVQMLFDFFFMATAVIYMQERSGFRFVVTMGIFLLSIAGITLIQQKVVDLERHINPEKKGSVYDANFKKTWLASCDEAEQKQIGQAAYRAYTAMNTAAPLLWILLVFAAFLFDGGILPVLILTLLWGTLNVSYILECIRIGKKSLP